MNWSSLRSFVCYRDGGYCTGGKEDSGGESKARKGNARDGEVDGERESVCVCMYRD